MRVVSVAMAVLFSVQSLPAHALTTPSDFPKYSIRMGNFDRDGIMEAAQEFYTQVEAGEKIVVFNIDSNGGSIFGGLALIKFIEDVKKARGVHTVCVVDTHAYSMGLVFLQSSACDDRYMTRRSTLLAHNGSTEAEGTANEIHNTEQMLRQLSLAMAQLVSDRLHMPLKDYQAKIEHGDWMFGSEEALKIGAVDGIVHENLIPPTKI